MDIHPCLQHKINKNINIRAGEKKKKHNIENSGKKKILECNKRTSQFSSPKHTGIQQWDI